MFACPHLTHMLLSCMSFVHLLNCSEAVAECHCTTGHAGFKEERKEEQKVARNVKETVARQASQHTAEDEAGGKGHKHRSLFHRHRKTTNPVEGGRHSASSEAETNTGSVHDKEGTAEGGLSAGRELGEGRASDVQWLGDDGMHAADAEPENREGRILLSCLILLKPGHGT
jgi:hypothetical protein